MPNKLFEVGCEVENEGRIVRVRYLTTDDYAVDQWDAQLQAIDLARMVYPNSNVGPAAMADMSIINLRGRVVA